MNHIDDDGYQGMIMEEHDDDADDCAALQLRRPTDLNSTEKSNNQLKVTGGMKASRIEQMQQHNWHKKFQAYKSEQSNMVNMKEALNKQLMILKQSLVVEDQAEEDADVV